MRTSHIQKRLLLGLILTGLLMPFQNCTPLHSMKTLEGSFNSDSPATFTSLKAQVFDPKCLACHSGGTTDLTSYAALLAGTSVQPGSPDSSPLYQRVQNHTMPSGGPPLSDSEILGIYNWIAAGAMDSQPPPVTVTPPAAPNMLTATAVSNIQVTLNWQDNSTNETGFLVERALNAGGPFTALSTAAANAIMYNDLGAQASTLYYYRVSALNSAGSSAATALASVTTPAPPATIPSPPSNLAAVVNSSSQITLNWNDNSGNETGFKIERSVGGGAFAQIFVTMANVTSYINTGLAAATTYTYRVRATNSAGDSAYTAVATGTTTAGVNMATYAYISANILPAKCNSCHNNASALGGVNLSTFAGVRATLIVNNSAASKLYTEVNSGSMPKGGAKLPANEIAAIKTWIDTGALNN